MRHSTKALIWNSLFLLAIFTLFMATIFLLSGCSTMDSFSEDSNCKATIEFECDCNCDQTGMMEEAVGIVK